MSKDIFGRSDVRFGGAMLSENTRMTFSGLQKEGLLLQSVQITYNQQITRLYTLQDDLVYFVSGRTEGGVTADQVIAPEAVLGPFFEKYGNVCNAGGNFTLRGGAGCNDSTVVGLVLDKPVITSLNISVNVQNMLITNNFSAQFVKLSLV